MPSPTDRIHPLDDPLLRQVPTIAGYKVLGKSVLAWRLGAGGMGIVWRGWHLDFGLPVAIKLMQPALAKDADYVQRFRHEAEAALRITHQNVVRVHDVEERFGLHFLVMEFVDGESLTQRIARTGRASVAEAATVLTATAAGLAEAHLHGLIHGDVKPDNVLISHQGRVKLADLGLVRPTAGTEAEPPPGQAVILGSRKYLAPEAWSAGEITPAADIWALGATAYFLLTGQHGVPDMPRREVGRWLRDHEYPTLAWMTPTVPSALVQVVETCVQRDPRARYPNGTALHEALRALSLHHDPVLRHPELADAEPLPVPLPEDIARIREVMERPVVVATRRRPMQRAKGLHPALALTGVLAAVGALAIALGGTWNRSDEAPATPPPETQPPTSPRAPSTGAPRSPTAKQPNGGTPRDASAPPAAPPARTTKPAAPPTTSPGNVEPAGPPTPDAGPLPDHKDVPIARGTAPGAAKVEVRFGSGSPLVVPVVDGKFVFDLTLGLDLDTPVILTAIDGNGRRSPSRTTALRTLHPPPRIEFREPAIGIALDPAAVMLRVRVCTFLGTAIVLAPGLDFTCERTSEDGSSTWACTLPSTAFGKELVITARDKAGNTCALQTAPIGVDLSGQILMTSAGKPLRWIPPIDEFEFRTEPTADAPASVKVKTTHGWWMAETTVTNEEWRAFVPDHPIPVGREKFAVTNITWTQADAYCKWLTEREANAGRLPAGHAFRLPPEPYRAIAAIELDPQQMLEALFQLHDTPVASGRTSPNAFGLLDMSRGVREWCGDAAIFLSEQRVNVNPYGDGNDWKGIRGAAWSDLYPTLQNWRERADHRDSRVGFRVALLPALRPKEK